MPGRDGRDILRELKSDPETSGIPVIVISVVDSADMPDLADGYLSQAGAAGPPARRPAGAARARPMQAA